MLAVVAAAVVAVAVGVATSGVVGDDAAVAAVEGSGAGFVATLKNVVGKIPVVGEHIINFEFTVVNVVTALAVLFALNFVFNLIFGEKNLPPFYNPGIPVLGKRCGAK